MTLLSGHHFVYFPKSVIPQSLAPEFIHRYVFQWTLWTGVAKVGSSIRPILGLLDFFLLNGNYHCQRSCRESVDRLEYQYHHKNDHRFLLTGEFTPFFWTPCIIWWKQRIGKLLQSVLVRVQYKANFILRHTCEMTFVSKLTFYCK